MAPTCTEAASGGTVAHQAPNHRQGEHMKKTLIALGAVVALTVPQVSSAGESIVTDVTIKADSSGDFSGQVKTALKDCSNKRKVVVKRQKGGKDEKIGMDLTEKQGNKYVWSLGNSGAGAGHFYAVAPQNGPCEKGKSKVIDVQSP